jgi:hypothetical protein
MVISLLIYREVTYCECHGSGIGPAGSDVI